MLVHLSILVILLFLNIIPNQIIDRKKYILPFSFLLILVYWAIRYDYGLDYWNYYNLFYTGETVKRSVFGERWFYEFTYLFKSYYQVIIAESIIAIVSLFHLVHKYISPRMYWLFFLLLFIVPDFHFNIISTQRTTMAACILYWAFDFFYIRRRRWILYIGMVLIATMFHASALVLVLFPLIYLFFSKLSGKLIFLILVVSNIISIFYPDVIFQKIVSFPIFQDYEGYVEVVSKRSLSFAFGNLLVLIPCWFMCAHYHEGDSRYDNICILAFLYLILTFLYLNFQGRYTVYLFPFFIMALCFMLEKYDGRSRVLLLSPYLFFLIYLLNAFYVTLYDQMNFQYNSGNPYYYHTIFEAAVLP